MELGRRIWEGQCNPIRKYSLLTVVRDSAMPPSGIDTEGTCKKWT